TDGEDESDEADDGNEDEESEDDEKSGQDEESDASEGNDFGLMDTEDEEDESEVENLSSDEGPEERPIGKTTKHLNKKQKFDVQHSDTSESDDESDEDSPSNQPSSDSENDFNASENEVDDEEEDESKPTKKLNTWEDIYGRKRDRDGNIIEPESAGGKYIPPHVRAKLAAESGEDQKKLEKLNRLKKQLKGWLNRLSEANIFKIVSDVDKLYMQNPRYDMNVTLTSLIYESLVSNVIAPERMVLEHMLLIAALHANVGSEVGAHFLQFMIEKFSSMLTGLHECDVEDKHLDNIILIICHMYTFKIFHHGLIFEILKKLTSELSEKSVECVLLTLKSIGFALRKDDPTALKELIATLQSKANAASTELKDNTRLKYMLDVLLAVKNNNVNKIPQYDPSLAEHLRKILKTLMVNGKYVTTLNITLDDLLKADQRGK
ncbi:Nucleolar MIF4G domain-containing protein 1 like, partial [Pseudolycoriella hygida]